MAAHDKAFFDAWFTTKAPQQPLGFVIRPPETDALYFSAGDQLTFELILFGSANEVRDDFFASIWQWGALGLGPKRAPFKVVSIDAVLPGITQPIFLAGMPPLEEPPIASVGEWLDHDLHQLNWTPNSERVCLNVRALTRIVLKQENGKLLEAPSLDTFVSAIERRLQLLIRWYFDDDKQLFELIRQARPNLPESHLISSVQFSEWMRPQKSTGQDLPFGGLLGQWSYVGHVQAAIPWLILGKLLHVGSKSSFGLGQYDFSFAALAESYQMTG
ncbi:CRISPR system precrRNA processing endoribonuclease RAMP protein Cas6 [Neiella sp. HB171785]|uniref:CRISPR system precrRNA processing endoribonuclease RAMP protein Cas6 n=1 Tax=Neiella litorisoli TaxID=2771431 RepID=A0A8J6R2Q4_9GAMM|nr:CRISPR system precrRNA processing endoribonuclease RAMP protein Cas6 [Neiella litorisoli]MBD1389275.1 CRISPR system precrRNA processing endoribonuclease RAMP protein Cas6 [Neiella litorisoli]